IARRHYFGAGWYQHGGSIISGKRLVFFSSSTCGKLSCGFWVTILSFRKKVTSIVFGRAYSLNLAKQPQLLGCRCTPVFGRAYSLNLAKQPQLLGCRCTPVFGRAYSLNLAKQPQLLGCRC